MRRDRTRDSVITDYVGRQFPILRQFLFGDHDSFVLPKSLAGNEVVHEDENRAGTPGVGRRNSESK
jgi:hypothetical protein